MMEVSGLIVDRQLRSIPNGQYILLILDEMNQVDIRSPTDAERLAGVVNEAACATGCKRPP
jgi:hypothetical protein